jgi:hypothetical protein
MTVAATITEAKRLIAAGRDTFATGGRVEPPHFSEIEYYVVYQAAIELLLREGFIDRAQPELHDAFFRLIPPPAEFEKEAAAFEGLVSDDARQRIQASARFDKLARAEASIYLRFLFQYPRTFERLLPAVRDPEPPVAENTIRALGSASHRYFPDPRVFEAILPVYAESKGKVLHAAVVFTSHVRDERKFEPLHRLLSARPAQPLLMAICRHFRNETPADQVVRAQPLLLVALERELNPETRNTVLATLVRSLDAETLPALQRLLRTNDNRQLTADLRASIHKNCPREQIESLDRVLFTAP